MLGAKGTLDSGLTCRENARGLNIECELQPSGENRAQKHVLKGSNSYRSDIL
jgi:hypothetical protein